VALTPAQCVGVVWAYRAGLAMAEA
jgi:hypothetical protein